MIPEVVAIGEPLLEFNACEPGSLRKVRSYTVGFGGDTSNFCIAAQRLGAACAYVTRLGDDEFGQIFLDLYEHEGVDTSHIIIEPNGFTGIYFISRKGVTHSFTYYRSGSAASHLCPNDVPVELIKRSKIFHTSGITQAISNSACDAAFYAMDVAKRAGVVVTYDPNIRLRLWSANRARGIVREAIRLADFVFPSLEDAKILSDKTDPRAIAEDLLTLGPKAVVIKLGEAGALLATPDEFKTFSPFKVEVIDTTGAGDTFDGAFVSAYLRNWSLSNCVIFANAAAALSTTKPGAVEGIPKFEDVEKFLQRQSTI